MATALPGNPDLECCICYENYKTPKVLSCGHSFCLECLVIYIKGRKGTFPCPFCKQDVEIPQGGAYKLITNFSLKTLTDSSSDKPKHYCTNHSKKEVEYYCQTCNLGLCSKCIYTDHKDHKTLDLEVYSTREKVVQELSKPAQFIKNKIEDLKKTHEALLETSEKLKSFCDEACNHISEKTEKIIGELIEHSAKIQDDIQINFYMNESKLTETRQKVMTQIRNIKTDLDTSCPTTDGPSLTLMYSLTKLQDLQQRCENIKTDIPPVTYVEWREGNVKVCDILGSTITKPLYQSSEGSGPILPVTKPLNQSRDGSGPILPVTKPLNQSRDGNGHVLPVTKPLNQYRGGSGPLLPVTKPTYKSRESSGLISTITNALYQSIEGSGPILPVAKPLNISGEDSRPISIVTKPLHQSRESTGTVSTPTEPLNQSSEGSGPVLPVAKPRYQFREGSGPVLPVAKPRYQSREGTETVSTVSKPLNQSFEGSRPISTVTKPLNPSREGTGTISTVTKPLNQSRESTGTISTVTKPLNPSRESTGTISTVTKPLNPSREGTGTISTGTKRRNPSREGTGTVSALTKLLFQTSVQQSSSFQPNIMTKKLQYGSKELFLP